MDLFVGVWVAAGRETCCPESAPMPETVPASGVASGTSTASSYGNCDAKRKALKNGRVKGMAGLRLSRICDNRNYGFSRVRRLTVLLWIIGCGSLACLPFVVRIGVCPRPEAKAQERAAERGVEAQP
jgi:hypothetical protein